MSILLFVLLFELLFLLLEELLELLLLKTGARPRKKPLVSVLSWFPIKLASNVSKSGVSVESKDAVVLSTVVPQSDWGSWSSNGQTSTRLNRCILHNSPLLAFTFSNFFNNFVTWRFVLGLTFCRILYAFNNDDNCPRAQVNAINEFGPIGWKSWPFLIKITHYTIFNTQIKLFSS